MPPIYLDRDTLNSFQSDAIGAQADLVKQSLANPPPHEPVPPPSPPPIQPTPDTPPAEPTPSSDSLTNPTRQAPPDLSSLLTAAGIVSPPADSAVPASTTGPAPVTPAPSGPPPLQSLLQSAGLADVGGAVGSAASAAGTAVRGAVDTVTNSVPSLEDVMTRAGLNTGATKTPDQATSPQTTTTTAPINFSNEVNQFGLGLPTSVAYAFCGPAAAIAFARQFGRNPTVAEAQQLAEQSGWTPEQGMAGIDSEKALLQKMGIATRVEENGRQDAPAFSWDHVTQDVLNGNPVILDAPGHYFIADAARTNANGQVEYHVGESGKALRQGKEWMTAADLNGTSMGAVRGALYADSPMTPQQSIANATGPKAVTDTTAGISGGGDASGQVGDRGQQILSGAANAASWLGDQGQKALQAVLVTEGGLNNARGDQGKSAGPLQFYEGGQLANLASQMNMTLDQAKTWVEQNPVAAVQWAIGTPDKPGYLGAAIQRGIQLGLSGPDLATYAQQHGQVSVSPERAGANWNALFSGGQSVIQGATNAVQSTVQGATQTADQAGQDLLTRSSQLVQSGGDLLNNVQNQGQSLEDYTRQKLAPINAEADRLMEQNRQATEALQQRNQQAMQQQSIDASTAASNQPILGGGLLGRSAVNVSNSGAGQTPEQIVAAGGAAPVQPATPIQPAPAPQGPLDIVKQKFSDALDALGGLFGGATQAVQGVTGAVTNAAQPVASALQTTFPQPTGLAALSPELQAAQSVGQIAQGAAASPPGQAIGAGIGAVRQAYETLTGPGSSEFPAGGPAAGPFVGVQRNVVGAEQLARENPEYGSLQQEYQSLLDQQTASGMNAANADQGFITRASRMQQIRQRMDQIASQANLPELAQRAPDIAQREETARTLQNVAGGTVLGATTALPDLVTNVAALGIDPSNVVNLPFQALHLLDEAGRIVRGVAGGVAPEAAAARGAVEDTGVLSRVGDVLSGRQEAQAALGPAAVAEAAPAAEGTQRFFHGTGGDFASPDAAKFDPNGLFGPGYYLTSDPRVAGGLGDVKAWSQATQGYAEKSPLALSSSQEAEVRTLQQNLTELDDELRIARPADAPSLQAERANYVNRLVNLVGTEGANVRPVDVPRNLNLFNADAPVTPEVVHAIADQLSPQSARELINSALPAENTNPMMRAQLANRGPATGDEVYRHLQDLATLERARAVNQGRPAATLEPNAILQRAGFDGIQYAGGNRVPMADSAGEPIQHTALVIFPESLDKLTNATSRTPGGRLALGAAQAGGPTGLQFATSVGGAAAGGEAGYNSDPNAPMPERIARGAAGAAIGGLAGYGAARGAEALFGRAPIAGAEEAASAGRLRGEIRMGPLGPQRGQLPLKGFGQDLPSPGPLSQDDPGGLLTEPQIGQLPMSGFGRSLPVGQVQQVQRAAEQLGVTDNPSRAFDLNALAQMRQQFQAQQPPLMQVARRAPGIMDRFIGYTIATMLWGAGTAVHITTSQTLQTLGRPLVSVAAGHPTDAVRDVTAMTHSISDAFSAFGRTIQTGQRQGLALQAPIAATRAEQVVQFPLRLHSAINEFFRTLNAAGGAAMEASHQLRENPNLSFQDVLQRFTPQIVDAGANAAARATFMEGGGAMKQIGSLISKSARDLMDSNDPTQRAAGFVIRWIVPMTHIPAVILGEGIRGLPVVNEVRGVQRAVELARGTPASTLASGQVVPAVAGSHYAAQQELGRTALTSFANLAILSEVAQGNITGDGPTTPADKERLMEAVDDKGNPVWRPNSVHLPDGRWMDYTGLGPIALSMSSIANLVEAAKDYAQKPPEQRTGGIPELAQDMLGREMGTIGQTWFLRGLADVLTAVKEGTIGGTGTQISQAGDRLVPFGALLNEVRGLTDPYARNPQNPLERIESRLPGVSQNIAPRLGATTGQPMEQPHDIFSTLVRSTPPGMMTPNPVAAEIARLNDQGNRVSVPYEVKAYKGAQQTPEQQQTIRQQVGTAVNLYASNLLKDPRYAALSDEQKARALSQAVGQAQAQADLTLGGQVARSPHDSALLQWAETAHYYGIAKDSTPEQIAESNWSIEQAKSKLAEYRKAYGDRAEGQLHRDDPQAYKLSQREAIESDVLRARKNRLDIALGGALSQAEQNPATGGLVGAGATTLSPVAPVQPAR